MLKSKVVLITGSTRGIGKAIADKFSKEKATVIITGKTTHPHKKLPNTIYSVADNINKNGGDALAIPLDIRDEESVTGVIDKVISTYGKLDILINNASAIDNSDSNNLTIKKYDLINSVNGRGTFMISKHCIPHLLKSDNPHVLTLSPPINLDPRWLTCGGVGYTISKYSMSLVTLGMSEEFKNKIAFNSLWPRYTIATEAIRLVAGKQALDFSLHPEIMADAALNIVCQDKNKTNNFYLAEDLIDYKKYKVNKRYPLLPDLYVGRPAWFEFIMSWSKKFV